MCVCVCVRERERERERLRDDDCFLNFCIYIYIYITLFSALEQTHCTCMWFLQEWLAFYSAFLNIHRSCVLILIALAWLLPCEAADTVTARRVLCTPYNHAPCHFMQSHIRKVYACLAVTCHLHFWQNDRDLLRATAVTRGWKGYWNKNQHRKLPPGEENYPAAPAGIRTCNLSITNPAL